MALFNNLDPLNNLYPESYGANLTTVFSNVVVNSAINSILRVESIFLCNPTTSADTISLVFFKTYRSILPNTNNYVICSNLSLASNTTSYFLDKQSGMVLQEGEYIQGMSTTGGSHIVISLERIS